MLTSGERIKEMRIKRGYTQEQMAEKLGMNRANFSNYERNVSTPPGEILVQMAEILTTSTDYLLGVTENPFPKDTGEMLQFDDPGVQVLLRAKHDLSDKAYKKLVEITEKMREALDAQEEDD